MPMFEFKCRQCNHAFTKLLWSSGAAESVQCPECGSKDVKRLISSFASFQPVGSGGGGSCGSGGFT